MRQVRAVLYCFNRLSLLLICAILHQRTSQHLSGLKLLLKFLEGVKVGHQDVFIRLLLVLLLEEL